MNEDEEADCEDRVIRYDFDEDARRKTDVMGGIVTELPYHVGLDKLRQDHTGVKTFITLDFPFSATVAPVDLHDETLATALKTALWAWPKVSVVKMPVKHEDTDFLMEWFNTHLINHPGLHSVMMCVQIPNQEPERWKLSRFPLKGPFTWRFKGLLSCLDYFHCHKLFDKEGKPWFH